VINNRNSELYWNAR